VGCLSFHLFLWETGVAERSWIPVFNFLCGRFELIFVEAVGSGTVFSFSLPFSLLNILWGC